MKHCCICKELKPLEEFFDNRRRKDNKQTYCISCNRDKTTEWYYKRKYGITLEERDNLLKAQDFKCKICNSKIYFEKGKSRRTGQVAVIDHCHGQGHIRGVLCGHCNTGLGSFKDSFTNLIKAAEYIKQNQQ
jgi:hypothetical protein